MLKKHKLHLSRLFCCNHTCYCVNMVSVTSVSRYITSASRYHPRYQSRSSMYICGLIPWNFAELVEAVPIVRQRLRGVIDNNGGHTRNYLSATELTDPNPV